MRAGHIADQHSGSVKALTLHLSKSLTTTSSCVPQDCECPGAAAATKHLSSAGMSCAAPSEPRAA